MLVTSSPRPHCIVARDAKAPLPQRTGFVQSNVALVTNGPDAVSALGGLLLRHRRCRSLVPVTMPSHLCYGVTVALPLNNVAVASPSHCRCAAMVLMQWQLVLGPGPGTDAHGLVGASGRGAITLLSRRRGAFASAIATAMVLTLRC